MPLRFGDLELDERLFELRRGGDPVKIEPKVFDVLRYLLEHRERVVSKDELLERLWPGETVSESVLPRCISAARKAVGDDPAEQRVIRTVHGRGYRFVAVLEMDAGRTEGTGSLAGAQAPEGSEGAVPDDRPAAGRQTGVFVGREGAMAELQAALADAFAGRGRLVLLVGEPGIGKTRTAEELGALAARRGARVLRGRCHEGEGAPAFWPWVQILRACVRDDDAGALVSALGPAAADLAELVPELAERLPDLAPPPSLPAEQARFRLFDSVTAFLKNVARVSPLVLVLDDLHWADAPSLLLVRFLARELDGARLLVVGAYRDVELGRHHPLAQVLGDLAREGLGRRIPLRGLTEADVARFIAEAARGPAPAALVAAVHRMTEGNPFFVGEIVRLLLAEGRLARPEEAALPAVVLPQGVRQAIGLRLNALSDECNRVLALAAVAGRELDLGVIERVAELPRDRLLALLDEAAGARILAASPGPGGRYSFSHALVRETLYEELASPRRIALHRRVGEVLEEVSRADPAPRLAELAHHFFQAAPGGDVARAVRYCVAAAERATRLLAYEEAAGHYERALQALDLAPPGGDAARCDLLLALGDAQARSGERERARETFRRAAEIARRLARPGDLARAALGFGGQGEMGMPRDDALLALLEEALGALGEEDGALRVRLLARLVGTAPYSESLETRAALSRDAVELARRLGDPETLLVALGARGWALLGPDHLEERLAVGTELAELARGIGDKAMVFVGHELRFGAFLAVGDMPAADREIDAAARLAREIRQPLYSWFAVWWRASRALCDGRFDEAERLRLEALAVGRRIQHPGAAAIAEGQALWLRGARGGGAEAFEIPFQFLLDYYPRAGIALRAGEAAYYCDAGRDAEARQAFETLAAHDFADIPRDEHWLVTLTALAQSCAALRDARRAAILYDQLHPFAHRNIVHDLLRTYGGSVSHHLALLAAALGRSAAAARHFEDALAMNARIGVRPALAQTRFAYAEMLLERGRGGDRRRAAALLDETLACATELGLHEIERKAAELRRRA